MWSTDFPNRMDRKVYSILLNRFNLHLWKKLQTTILPGIVIHVAKLPFHPCLHVKEIKTSHTLGKPWLPHCGLKQCLLPLDCYYYQNISFFFIPQKKKKRHFVQVNNPRYFWTYSHNICIGWHIACNRWSWIISWSWLKSQPWISSISWSLHFCYMWIYS